MTQQVSEELSVTEDLRVNGTMYGIKGSTHNRSHFVVTVVLLRVSGTSKAIGLIQILKGLNIYSTMQHTEELQSPKKAAFDLSTNPKSFLPDCPISEWSQFLQRICILYLFIAEQHFSVWPEVVCEHPVKLDMILIRQMQRFWTVVDIYMLHQRLHLESWYKQRNRDRGPLPSLYQTWYILLCYGMITKWTSQ